MDAVQSRASKRFINKFISKVNTIDIAYYHHFKDLQFLYQRDKRLRNYPDIAKPMLDVVDYIILISNNVEFPQFNIQVRNILPWMTKEYINTCLYNETHSEDKYCPRFRLKDVLRMAEANEYRILRRGGVIAITIHWDCDLDWSLDNCVPRYDFFHLDGQNASTHDALSIGEGWPLETAYHYGYNGAGHVNRSRVLIKVNGIHVLVLVNARAGKFSFNTFSMNFGASLALFEFATILCDFLLFKCTKNRKEYLEACQYKADSLELKRKKPLRARTSVPGMYTMSLRMTARTSRSGTHLIQRHNSM